MDIKDLRYSDQNFTYENFDERFGGLILGFNNNFDTKKLDYFKQNFENFLKINKNIFINYFFN